MQQSSGLNLVDFATGVIIVIPLMFQKEIFGQNYIAWTWLCLIGSVVTTSICLLGRPSEK